MTISTASAPKYWQTNFLPTATDSQGQPYIDVLSDQNIDLLNVITSAAQYTVKEGDKLTTVCYQFYQNTSLYWVILYYNGLIFWDEVKPGDIIYIPDFAQINSFFGRNQQQVGQQVII